MPQIVIVKMCCLSYNSRELKGAGGKREILANGNYGAPVVMRSEDIALINAAIDGNVENIKSLLKAGAKLDVKDDNGGHTPLIWAAIYGRTEAVKVLLEEGAKIGAKGENGNTAKILAAKYDHLDVVRVLEQAEAQVRRAKVTGETGFIKKFKRGHSSERERTR